MIYQNIREEELKNKVAQDYFADYDCSKIVGNVDFTVVIKNDNKQQQQFSEDHSLLWAEAKTGNFELIAMFAQLILTIGKARTFDKNLPPAFLGAFDFVKIAFVPYEKIQHLFFKNDFNWNVTASNHESKEFKEIHTLIKTILKTDKYEYQFGKDDAELKFFIKNNIAKGTESGKIQIDKNNFVPIYLRWLDVVKPLINFDFAEGKKQNIVDSDFYLADLFVDDHDTATTDDDTPLKEELFVVFRNGHYQIAKENLKSLFNATIEFTDKKAYEQFWKRYKRPPINEFHNYIIERRDLLVPQDIRERKGAFFTPRQWVELSQKYLADVLGKNWQDEYYVWDCAAGTGNLLAGLTNKYNIWASTLDQADVNVMHDRITNGANLLQNHVFQFDFLNDDFTKLPQALQDIINDEEKRKKLVIYINPPYAEATTARTVSGTGENKGGVATNNKINEYYNLRIGNASNEIFALFMAKIYEKIPNATLAQFSKLKFIQGSNFIKFKEYFLAKYLDGFIVPANTFDNVKGTFPIGFTIWSLDAKTKIKKINTKVYSKTVEHLGKKYFYGVLPKSINKWVKSFDTSDSPSIGFMENPTPDFQNNKFLNITNNAGSRHNNYYSYNFKNLLQGCIYFSARFSIKPTWLNDRDQFLYPNESWKKDKEFQNDCLSYAIFHGQNRISSKLGINNWLPFTEQQVNAKEKFASNFMTDFIQGKINPNNPNASDLFIVSEPELHYQIPLKFSSEATDVFDAGRELWTYYHAQKFPSHGDCMYNVNASFYDIREYFQGRNDKGRMNTKSTDPTYTQLISNLREQLNNLANTIAPKVYEYEFLKE